MLLKVLVALASQKEDLAIDFDPSVIHATQAMFMIIILLNYLIAVISHSPPRLVRLLFSYVGYDRANPPDRMGDDSNKIIKQNDDHEHCLEEPEDIHV